MKYIPFLMALLAAALPASGQPVADIQNLALKAGPDEILVYWNWAPTNFARCDLTAHPEAGFEVQYAKQGVSYPASSSVTNTADSGAQLIYRTNDASYNDVRTWAYIGDYGSGGQYQRDMAALSHGTRYNFRVRGFSPACGRFSHWSYANISTWPFPAVTSFSLSAANEQITINATSAGAITDWQVKISPERSLMDGDTGFVDYFCGEYNGLRSCDDCDYNLCPNPWTKTIDAEAGRTYYVKVRPALAEFFGAVSEVKSITVPRNTGGGSNNPGNTGGNTGGGNTGGGGSNAPGNTGGGSGGDGGGQGGGGNTGGGGGNTGGGDTGNGGTQSVPTSAEYDELPAVVTLSANYPNPFNPSTEISYTLPAASSVRLEVFDMTGKIVATLVDGARPAGAHTAHFSADGLPTGTYVYRLQAGTETLSRTMTLVK